MNEYKAFLSFLLRRLGSALALVVAVIIFNFILIHAAPGDPAAFLAGEFASPEYYEQVRAQYGFDRPVAEQLLYYLNSGIRGDFGQSFRFGRPVMEVILSRVPATLILTGSALTIASILGVLLGLVAGWKASSATDQFITAASLIGYSIPIFWLAQMLLLFFALRLKWFPVQGMLSLTREPGAFNELKDLLHHLVLPCASLTIYYLALIIRMTRAKVIDELEAPYVITARSKGVPSFRLVYRHVMRNAILPVVTIIGYNFSLMFSGSVLTETVFAWPGLGRLIFDAIFARDYPLLMASFVFIAVSVIFFNFLTDLIYGLIDPRVRYA